MASDLVTPSAGPTLRIGDRPVLPELAPSEERTNEPWFSRILGVVGLVLLVPFGLVVLLRYYAAGPGLVDSLTGISSEGTATLSIALGVALMLLHAARDSHVYVRRFYLGVAALGLVACLATLLIPGTVTSPGGEVVRGIMAVHFPIWGSIGLFLAIAFALVAGRHEDDEQLLLITAGSLFGFGMLLGLVGIGGGIIHAPPSGKAARDFFLNPGFLMAFLGLISACAGLSLTDTSRGLGYYASLSVGVVGLLAIIYALARTFTPMIMTRLSPGSELPGKYFSPYGLLLLSLGVMYLMAAVVILSDLQVMVLVRRELTTFFYSPIAWMVLAGMVFFGGFQYMLFFGSLVRLGEVPEPVVRRYLLDWFPVFAVVFVVPLLTMRLFSEERRNATLEMLLTAPLNEGTLVISKFLAGLCMFLLACVPWGLFLLVLRVGGGRPFDHTPLLGYGVVLVVTGSVFVSMGMFFSSLTRDQIIAAMLTFVGMLLSVVFYLVAVRPTADLQPTTALILKQLSFIHLWFEAMEGRVWTQNIILQASLTCFWLFLTVKVLEFRKWS